MRWILVVGTIGLLIVAASPGWASETLTYTYDALGRLVAVVHSGSVNNNLQTNYQYDLADNRNTMTVTGAPQ